VVVSTSKCLYRITFVVIFVALLSVPVCSQACGYIYARFEIKNSKGEIVDDAKISLLGRDSNKSILYEKSEIAFSKEEKAFKLTHGMCGSHFETRLVVKHSRYATYEELIDLPLNSPKNEHVFLVELKDREVGASKSSNGTFAVNGFVVDDLGSVIPDTKILVDDMSTGRPVTDGRSDFDGKFSFQLPDGSYAIKVKSRHFDDFVKENVLVSGKPVEELKIVLKCAKCEILACPSGQLEVEVETTPLANLSDLRVSPRPIEQLPVSPAKLRDRKVRKNRSN